MYAFVKELDICGGCEVILGPQRELDLHVVCLTTQNPKDYMNKAGGECGSRIHHISRCAYHLAIPLHHLFKCMLYPIAIATTWYQGTETNQTNKQTKILLAEHEQWSEPSLVDT